MLEATPTADLLERAREHALAAVASHGEIGETHLALGSVQYLAGESLPAARSLRAAVARAPSSPDAHELLGILLLEAGLIDVGLQRLATASRMNPGLRMGLWEQARVLGLLERWSEVAALHERAIQIGFPSRECWLHAARFATWRRDVEVNHRLRASFDTATLGPDDVETVVFVRMLLDVHFCDSDPTPMFELLSACACQPSASPRRALFCLQLLAETAAYVGDRPRALAAVEGMCALGSYDALWLDRCPLLEPLREHPRVCQVRARARQHAELLLDEIWAGAAG